MKDLKRPLQLLLTVLLALLTACGGGGGGTGSNTQSSGNNSSIDTTAIDSQAVSMAEKILSGGDQTEPALQQALLTTGFAVQATDGSLTQPTPTLTPGMLFTQWDVDVMTTAANNGGFITLDDFAAALQLVFPELDASQITTYILAGVSDSAQSDQPTIRAWARLIVELGRQREVPYDLLDPNVDPTQVNLSPIQVDLLAQQLIADLIDSSSDTDTADTTTASVVTTSTTIDPLQLGLPTAREMLLRATNTSPCTLTDTQQLIMDGAAKAETKGFKALLGYLKKQGIAGANTLSKLVGRINAVLKYVKLLTNLLAFNMDLKANLAELVRTLSTVNGGQQMDITATVSFDNGNYQILNCVRQVGNLLGVDFKLTPTGPIKNAEINWYLLEGGTNGIAGQLGYLRWALHNLPNVDRYTDSNGQDTITIEGAPQQQRLLNPHSVEKPGKVHAKINLKSANIVKDLMDAMAGASTLPVEMAYRTGLGFERSLSFTVVDWEDCNTAASLTTGSAKASNVCIDTWTGTSSFTMGADPATAYTTSANITWVLKEIIGDVEHYQATGTAHYAVPDCVPLPESQSISPDEGELTVDYSTDPPTYQFQGATVWPATYTCANGALPPLGAGGLWGADPSTFQSATGTVVVDVNSNKLTIFGGGNANGLSASWSFTKD